MYIDKDVRCPFYMSSGQGKDKRYRIRCEAVLEGSESMQSVFLRKDAFDGHMDDFCCGNYFGCPMQQAISEKYPEK